MDSSSSRAVCWFDNPNILFGFMLFQLLVVRIEVSEFIRKDVSVWNKVIRSFSMLLLHLGDVVAAPILPSNFVATWEMVDFLEFVETFVEVALTRTRSPKNVPFM
jgi:hypothetical protein